MKDAAALFCIGHSHVACVQEAAGDIPVKLRAVNFWHAPGALIRERDRWRLSDGMLEELRQRTGPVFSLIGGASYGVMGMLVHPRPWDFVLPERADWPLAPGTECVPFDAVQLALSQLMDEYLELTVQLRKSVTGRIYHLEPPPPHADAGRITPHIPWALYPGMRQEVAPAMFRYKLWQLQSQLLRAHCEKHGLDFVPHPAAADDAQGFLADVYFLDGAHANAAYGALVLDQMRRLHEASL